MGCCVSQNEQRAFVNVNGNPVNPHQNASSQRSQEERPRRSLPPPAMPNSSQSNQNSAQNAARITYLQNPGVEKVIAGQVSGEGIKATPAYETPLTSHELNKWRQEFWETRTQGQSHIWQLLKNACSETHDSAEALILAAGLTMPQNSLTLVIDENGVYYRVPLCCINEPMNYSVNSQDEKLKEKEKPPEILYNVSSLNYHNLQQDLKVRSSKGICELKASNWDSVIEFKQKYINAINDNDLKVENIRMFCLGKEFKDDLFLYNYDLVDEMTVQVMFKK
ncbi:UNKNOWN [Stylonychia lemnae]|uniref:Ubiquitin-like domain-containing protein n=1 Tax=Stylonychia lemnae TaxID=5949 RepID=A0A078AZP8_STYLE|nr:UNKNOWN [Stylonychia lemnae]|eukprot:CDW87679.1 UNKNOWN [Stylonychia lemnae]